ncbi:uncharacterized protein LOC105687863 [Athalia rosae]|uniref:uncharacterized protein LOC105687863 n=1 Tax=Athalia rosae TaxID=37344 RepID=UPI0006259922|nr:uncharacterized protein LOC105687863 [Athalia rosae]
MPTITPTNDLVRYQKELKEEEELIQKMLSKIDRQLEALQVEQLQLINALRKNARPAMSSTTTNTYSAPVNNISLKEELDLDLDLDVPSSWNLVGDMEEEDSN